MEEDRVSISVHDYDEIDCDSVDSGSYDGFSEFTRNGLVRLRENDDEGNSEYNGIKRNFVAGMGFLGKDIRVVAIHKNSYSSVAGKAKLEAFRVFSKATAERRGGDANAKLGWYGGGSHREISDIVVYGFGKCGGFDKAVSCGIGVHLSPANLPFDSALKTKEDENGVRHILLCRVILGSTETICAGSQQFQPSSIQFDSGIDNPLSPTKYIIWSAYMNSHIFPNYIISFTAPLMGSVGNVWNSARKPNSPSMKFCVLLNILSRFLNPSKMNQIQNYYNDFRENKIARPQLIAKLRSLVGDNILISVIKLCKDEV